MQRNQFVRLHLKSESVEELCLTSSRLHNLVSKKGGLISLYQNHTKPNFFNTTFLSKRRTYIGHPKRPNREGVLPIVAEIPFLRELSNSLRDTGYDEILKRLMRRLLLLVEVELFQ